MMSSTQDQQGMNIQKNEGKTTAMIESKTAQVPSLAYMGLAIGSMALSAGLFFSGKQKAANFVGQWVPTLLVIGLYNKLVKIEHEVLGAGGIGGGIGGGSSGVGQGRII